MEMYFLKSAACLAILMLFYKLLLEKENMHVFKRFYLLAAVIVSFAIPFITFTTYVEIPAVPTATFFEVEEGAGAEKTLGFADLVEISLWMLYGLGVLFFGMKFYRNLQEILQKIKRNPQVKTGNTTNVLLQEKIAPHTFWNYIFLNRVKYQKRQIPVEVFEHEQAHARQKHSFDILLMELLQVVFWFHPLLYLVKRAIKLNHEFLADQAVIERGIKTSTYQETLLAFSSGAANSSFVNSINYSSIKKRFTVMKTHTSKTAIWIRSFLLVPVLAVLIYSCSTSEELEKPLNQDAIEAPSQKATPEMIAEYNRIARNYNAKEGVIAVLSSSDYNRLRPIYDLMTEEQKLAAEPFPKVDVIEVVDDESATPAMLNEYNKLAKHYRERAITEATVQEEGFKRMMYIFGIMTEAQRKNATELPPPPPPQRVSEELPPPPPPPVKEVEVIGYPAPTAADSPSPPPVPVEEVEVIGYPSPRSTVEKPSAPPPPPSPEQAIKNWDAEGAEFYFEGNRISAQDALDLVESGKELQVKRDESGAVKKIRLSIVKD